MTLCAMKGIEINIQSIYSHMIQYTDMVRLLISFFLQRANFTLTLTALPILQFHIYAYGLLFLLQSDLPSLFLVS